MDDLYPTGACMVRRPSRRNATQALQVAGMALGLGGLIGLGLGGFAPLSAIAQETGGTTSPTAAFCATENHNPVGKNDAMTVADVAAKVNPAVVTVNNEQAISYRGGRGIPSGQPVQGDQTGPNGQAIPVGTGSGFIVDQEGHVVTNAHVVDGADKLSVNLYDGTTVPATVVGQDDQLDIAVIKLDLPAGVQVPGVAAIGDSNAVRPGDEVVAIGSALGEFTNTVSDGTVNAVDRSLPDYGLSSLIQHDAEIWHGNSGGPLINLRGEVVGVNAAGLGGSDMGYDTAPASIAFAIESNPMCKSVGQLIATGKATWPYIGVSAQLASDGKGEEIAKIVADGPAASAGLKEGDVITAVDGTKIDAQHPLLKALIEKNPGDKVTLTVQQGGAERTVDVTLGERPDQTS